MSTLLAYREESDNSPDGDRTAAALGHLPPETLRPLLEGARARGLADAFELMGIPAVLIDTAGAVLHVGAGAAAQMGTSIAVASRHLVGVDPTSNRAVQDVVAAALAGETKTVELQVAGVRGGLSMRGVPMPRGWENPYQMLKAAIVFCDASKAIDERASDD
jgi:hypothetical protein